MTNKIILDFDGTLTRLAGLQALEQVIPWQKNPDNTLRIERDIDAQLFNMMCEKGKFLSNVANDDQGKPIKIDGNYQEKQPQLTEENIVEHGIDINDIVLPHVVDFIRQVVAENMELHINSNNQLAIIKAFLTNEKLTNHLTEEEFANIHINAVGTTGIYKKDYVNSMNHPSDRNFIFDDDIRYCNGYSLPNIYFTLVNPINSSWDTAILGVKQLIDTINNPPANLVASYDSGDQDGDVSMPQPKREADPDDEQGAPDDAQRAPDEEQEAPDEDDVVSSSASSSYADFFPSTPVSPKPTTDTPLPTQGSKAKL